MNRLMNLFINSSMTSFIDNTIIKLTIYFNSHMCIDEQITNNLFIFIYIYKLYFTDEYHCSFDTDCNIL